MQSALVTTRITPDEIHDLEQLIDLATHERGYRPVSDQFWLDLRNERTPPPVSVRYFDHEGVVLAYVQGSVADDGWNLESVTRDDGPVAMAALATAIDAVVNRAATDGAANISWLVQGPTERHAAIAQTRSFVVDRELHQMRRSLPTDLPFHVETRDFDPSRDVDAWVRVNARAFAWNPDQGSWTADSLRSRMREPWFDAAGFRIHERDGRLAGFCWTKVHADTAPPLGEIYVIAVDPDFHGQGLGRDLTLAGLDHLARQGLRTGMLFVDGDNVAAIRVYDRLGFVVQRVDTIFRKQL